MAQSIEKALSSAKQTLFRLDAIQGLAKEVEFHRQPEFKFFAAFETARELYNEFQQINKNTVIDESCEIWQEYAQNVLNIDSVYFDLKGFHLQITRSQTKPPSPQPFKLEDPVIPEPSLSQHPLKPSLSSHFPQSSFPHSRQPSSPVHSRQPSLSGSNESFTKYSSGNNMRSSDVRLPKLDLPHFNGDLKSWPTFYDLFNALIHENGNLSPIEKFQYLISTLSQEPLCLVRHLPIKSDNYQIAYQTLVDRYQNDRVLATHYWNSLVTASNCTTDSPQSLRDLLNIFLENSTALQQFSTIELWDFTLFNWLLSKLDNNTRKRFEIKFAQVDFPSFGDLKQFLTDQCRALETNLINQGSRTINKAQNSRSNWRTERNRSNSHVLLAASSHKSVESKSSCSHCKSTSHPIFKCPSFLELTPQRRYLVVKSSNLCYSCLSAQHTIKACKSASTCRHCSGKHNTLLHFPKQPISNAPPTDSSRAPSADNTSSHPVVMSSMGTSGESPSAHTVLLATVLLEIKDAWGNFQTVRALCDSGSQSSFLTDRSRKRLGLPFTPSSASISGLGHGSVISSHGHTQCCVRPVGSKEISLEVYAMILPAICSDLPSISVSTSKAFSNLKLADPKWHLPGPVDMLLGADVFACIVQDGFIAGDGQLPAAMNTVFGWVLLGKASSSAARPVHSFFASSEPCLDHTLKRFWEVEEVSTQPLLSPEDQLAEDSFVHSHFREHSGRFGISLPFKDSNVPSFNGSLQIADRRLLALERRLSSQPVVRDMYHAFMRDYLDSGHMSEICDQSLNQSGCYYIPHHCVFKANEPSSKIRVVFDASAKDSNGLCLNDSLLTGSKLQTDISVILLRFRMFPYVFTCDIRQMYRQITVSQPHRHFQLIRWRFSPADTVKTYMLNTVTYGVSSSPYLAIRCLLQLAQEGEQDFPLASQAIRSSLYVDDFAVGTFDYSTALELRDQLVKLLASGCFELRKWASNDQSILEGIPADHCQVSPSTFDGDSESLIKILGLQWNSSSDVFSFRVKPIDSPCSKRSILSEVARIYDPLGFLCPLTFFAKRLIQHLWTLGLDWDTSPPEEVCTQWEHFKRSLLVLSTLTIPRCLRPSSVSSCQLHAFCDASELGYAAVAYFRIVDGNGDVHVSFVMAKSKVAPLKRLSIPRLELCAAVLLADLVSFILRNCQNEFQIDQVFAWSDSTVALSWICSPPYRWKTFVANRVSFIQDQVSPDCWHHVRSADNPADPASRGLLPEDLLACSLWWAGPIWLKNPCDSWVSSWSPIPTSSEVASEGRVISLVSETTPSEVDHLLIRFSSLAKIQRILVYCLRFSQNTRQAIRVSGPITDLQMHHALTVIVKAIQVTAFANVFTILSKGLQCPKYLQNLSPFIDSEGILRVGGRLTHSSLPYETKHPALLPGKHRLTELLIHHIHTRHSHAGINTTMYLVQQNFWILSARKSIRHYLHNCNHCFRLHPHTLTPPMGDLPSTRVSQLKAFSVVGVDFGGPLSILLSRRRGAKTQKAYLCLFVCFATKALHIEVASDLSAETFLAALRRFIARRGRCSQIISDNATNFVGANKELIAHMKHAVEYEAINWKFHPPSAPHFSGLVESGIKSVKSHLSRVIGKQILTYEELVTVCVQVESLLNSRPLCSLSSDPNDLRVLSPGHFLTLEPLTAAPDPDLSHLQLSRLSRWQLVQRLHHDFWKRWRDEYLHNFYQRGKWSKTHLFEPVDVGTMVLIKDENAPPLQWRIGRIEQLHPGADKIARVATVRTAHGVFKRPLVKLCPLPSQ